MPYLNNVSSKRLIRTRNSLPPALQNMTVRNSLKNNAAFLTEMSSTLDYLAGSQQKKKSTIMQSLNSLHSKFSQ
jgi:hypothetical protein